MDYEFPIILGIIIIPTDELIFFRGVGIPPTGLHVETPHEAHVLAK